MADDRGLPRLHQDDRQWLLEGLRDDLRSIFEATARGPAAPPPGRPPLALDGLDAQQFNRLKDDVLRDIEKVVHSATAEFLPEDEISDRIKSVSATIDQRFDAFKQAFLDDVRKVVKEEIGGLRREFFEIFEDLDMPLEREGGKRKKTAERLSGLWAMHDGSKEFKSELWKAIRAWSITGVVSALGAGLTYILTRGGPPH